MKNKKRVIFNSVVTAVVLGSFVVSAVLTPFANSRRNQAALSELTESIFDVNSLTDISSDVKESLAQTSGVVSTLNEEADQSIDSDEEVWAIVQLSDESLLNKYLASDRAMDLNQYITTESSISYQKDLLAKQKSVFNNLKNYSLDEVKYNYTTLLNGFSIPVRYGDISKLEKVSGVSNVIISEKYYPQTTTSTTSSITENDVNVYSTGIYNSSNVDYDGTGTIVAILDTGLDYTHSAFQKQPTDQNAVSYTRDDVASVVDQTVAYQLSASKASNAFTLTTNDVYLTSKVPYAYDYADKDSNVYPVNDHGTHVAGIIAGSDDTITGVATEAQLAIMKVFSDEDHGAQTADILSALSDCILLNVDAINMSLGSSCGFAREGDDDAVNTIYDGIKEAGVSLIVAASNDYSSAFGSEKGDTNLTSNPDSGTIGSPSSYPAAMSVASISGVKTPYFMYNGNAIYFTESAKTNGDNNKFVSELLGNNTELTLDYVTIPGTGNSSDYIGIDVTGKIAVVKRGVNTFEEKILTAQALGAIAIIIYNNQSGTISMSVGNNAEIPSCSISMDAGKYFTTNISGSLSFSTSYLAGPFMSGFSSWGVLPDLELKPDITAHGGDIYSSVRGGYDTFSGTSMACPNMAGATLLVRQYVKEKYPELTNGEVTNLAYQLMMSTATIAMNEEGNPYSPRKQGAGIADILKATTSSAYLWVEGSNKTKLSLGDDPTKSGHYTLVFNITNISEAAQSYYVNPTLFTETVSSDGETVAEKAYMFNDFNYTVAASGATVNNNHVLLKGYDTATITVTIDLSDADKAYLDANFVNGMYVEGFVGLENDDTTGVSLSIPYLAFYGDWTVAPMFDVTEYEVGASLDDTAVLEDDKLKPAVYATVPMGGFRYNTGSSTYEDGSWGLGVYGYTLAKGYTAPNANEDKASITENIEGLYKIAGISAGLLRGAKSLDVVIVNAETGELVYQDTLSNGRKSYYSSGRVGGFIELNLSAAEYGLANNTKYTFTMVGYLDWDGEQNNLNNTFTFDFYVDSQAPEVESTKVRIKEDTDGNKTYYLDMNVYDNHYLQCYSITSFDSIASDGSYVGEDNFIEYTIPVDSARGVTSTVTLDITRYWDDLQKSGKSIAVEFLDYARNQSTYTFKLPDTLAEELNFTQDSYTVRVNDAYDLFKIMTMTPADSFKHLISFESSDESIVRVFEGEIFGVAEGTATVTATTPTGYSKSIEITVSGKKNTTISLNSLDLGKTSMSMKQGESYTVTAKCEPWYFDASNVVVTWRSSNEKIAKVVVDENDPFTATFTALDSGSCSIVCQSGKYITSRISLFVEEEFEVEGRILKKYHGRGDENGVVTIPDDLGIMQIYQYAFINNEYITKIIIPEGITTINEAAIYGCDNLVEIVMPKSMETIANFGCAWNPKLEKVDLGGTKTIHDTAFIYDTALSDIDLSNVHNIGYASFNGCTSLTTIDLSNCGGLSNQAFSNCSGLKEIIMTSATSLQGTQAFANCTGLVSLIIPTNYVGVNVFANCTSLTSVVFTNDVTVVDTKAFYNCTKLTNVTYQKSLRKIGSNAFENCVSLNNVYLPAGLEEISESAFTGCSNITSVTVSSKAKLPTIGNTVFASSKKLTSFTVEAGNNYMVSNDGILYDISGTELLLVPTGKEFTTFTVPAAVKVIGSYAFAGMTTLESIDLTNVTVLEEGAFFGCTALKDVNYSNCITEIGAMAFANCASIERVVIPTTVKTIGYSAFAGVAFTGSTYTLVIPSSVESIGFNAFNGNTAIAKVEFAADCHMTEIDDQLFANCTSLVSIEFPDSITKIGSYVFYGCTSLTTVKYPTSVVEFGTYNYYGATALRIAYLPVSLEFVPEFTFYGCTSLTAFNASNITSINAGAFANSGLTGVSFGNVTSIGEEAFVGTSLSSVASGKILTIEANAFAQVSTLKQINLPAVKTIALGAFQETGLTKATLTACETIGDGAFYSCTALTSISLPKVVTVGVGAFLSSGLTSAILPIVETIGEEAFASTALTTFAVANSVKFIGEEAFTATASLASFTVGAENTKYYAEKSVLYRHLASGYNELVAYPALKTGSSYTVADNTARIAAGAFYGNEKLRTVDLPETLTQIGHEAFYATKITKYNFHSAVAPNLESFYDETSTVNYKNFNSTFGDSSSNITISIPKNGSGYTSYLYSNFFKTVETTDVLAPTADTLYLKKLIASLPADITAADKEAVLEAYTIYNILSKDMKTFITTDEKAKLDAAKAVIDSLNA